MSESVKIGGIGKNPAIDKINRLNSIDVKNYAANRMEELLFISDLEERANYKEVPIDFGKAVWEGKQDGKK